MGVRVWVWAMGVMGLIGGVIGEVVPNLARYKVHQVGHNYKHKINVTGS